MRHLILVLMIALLPLRSWSSDMMSIDMAAQQLQLAGDVASESAASSDMAAMPATAQVTSAMAMPANCPFSAISQQVPADEKGKLSPLCKGCTTCQLCMALTSGPDMSLVQANQLPEEPRALLQHGYASADRALQLKPPIS